jgi:hypothetical protein
MIQPHVVGILYANSITIISQNLGNLDVANDDVVLVGYLQTNTVQCGITPDDGGVGSNLDDTGATDRTWLGAK